MTSTCHRSVGGIWSKPETADVGAEQRQPVGEKPRVAASHALDTDACRPEGWRRRLHAKTAHFIQHHDDVARRHELFLFDLFGVQHLDAHRLILDALVGSRRRDRDVFLDRGLSLQLDWNHLRRAEYGGHGHRDGIKTLFDHRDFHRTCGDAKRRPAFGVGLGGGAAHNDLRSEDRAAL